MEVVEDAADERQDRGGHDMDYADPAGDGVEEAGWCREHDGADGHDGADEHKGGERPVAGRGVRLRLRQRHHNAGGRGEAGARPRPRVP